jgi:hypothetical protein
MSSGPGESSSQFFHTEKKKQCVPAGRTLQTTWTIQACRTRGLRGVAARGRSGALERRGARGASADTPMTSPHYLLMMASCLSCPSYKRSAINLRN